MDQKIILAKRGDTEAWKLIERCYNIIKQLEDGCSSTDICLLLQPPATPNLVSSAISWLALAKNSPITSTRVSNRHVDIKIVAPLPDVLYDDARRERHIEATERAWKSLESMNRQELLVLKIKINEMLNQLGTKPAPVPVSSPGNAK